MQLRGLISISLILILASDLKGQCWVVDVNQTIHAVRGSNVIIPCNVTFPTVNSTNKVDIYWKKKGHSTCSVNDKDTNAFVFHPDDKCVIEKYRRKTKLIGNTAEGDCTLQILNILDSEPNIYVRVSASGQNYSFKTQSVYIHVNDTSNPDFTDESLITIYASIFAPVAALLIIFVVAAVLFYVKRKRSQTLTREGSGFYANFSRATSNPPQRESSYNKQDKKRPEMKVIDDPVYVNVEAPTGQMDQSMDHAENIYANVDYTK